MLPDGILQITRQLYELGSSSSILGRTARNESIIRLLNEIQLANEPSTLPCIAKFLLSSDDHVRSVAIAAVEKVISSVDPYDLIQLSDNLIWSYYWHIDEKWTDLKPSDVGKLIGNSVQLGQSSILGMLSFHRSGYVRHEAVRNLSNITTGGELPFLLIRQNDWVHPVAADAQRAVYQRIGEKYVRHFAKCLRLILHLESLKRHDHTNAVRRIIELLLDEKNDDLLKSMIGSVDSLVRRRVVRHAFDLPGEHQRRVQIHGIESDDPSVRLQCCVNAKTTDSELFEKALDRFSHDPFMPVRRQAFEQMAIRSPAQAEEIWRDALFDASLSIREFARFELKSFGYDQARIARIYRESIAQHPESFSALQGLAETGDATDAEFFRECLTHRLPSRRVAAIRGLAMVCNESAFAELIPFLRDSSHRVIRHVQKSIGSKARFISGGELENLALNAPSFYSRKIAINLVFGLGKWQSIPWLLSIATHAEQETAVYAENMILRWFEPPESNRVFILPTEQNKVDIQARLAKSKRRMARTSQLIQNELKLFGSECGS